MAVQLEARSREGGDSSSSRGSADQQLLLPGQHERLQSVERSRHFAIPVGTHWVERDVLYVSEEIARRWPNLLVVSCSCGQCGLQGHYPHMVMESCRDGETRPVFGFHEFGRHLIERLQAAHNENTEDLLERMHKENEKVRKAKRDKVRDQQREAAEVVGAALQSPKLKWRGPGGVTTDTSKAGRVL